MRKAAVNVHVQACRFLGRRRFSGPLGKEWGLWLMDPVVKVCLVFWEPTRLQNGGIIYIPTSVEWGFLELSILHSIWCCQCSCFTPSHRCALVSSFNLHFPDDSLKEISPEYSSEGLMLKLKLQYFGHRMWRTNSLEKTLMLGKIEGWRRGRQRMTLLDASPTRSTRVWANSESWWWTGRPGVLQSMGSQRVGQNWAT